MNPNRYLSETRTRFSKVRKHGIFESLKIAKNLLFRDFIRRIPEDTFHNIVNFRRELLGERLSNELSNTVEYGPFKGLILGANQWGARDRASMLLGTYELEVVEKISSLPDKYSTFVDIGAADGFFTVGALVSRRFDKVACFESSEQGRNSISSNAIVNHVHEKILILDLADKNFVKILRDDHNLDIDTSVFLIDIEGGELDILTPENLSILRNSFLVVEIHEEAVDYYSRYPAFLKSASDYFDITHLTSAVRNPSLYKEISQWTDNDRLAIFSEGRSRLMNWVVLSPKV